jgi:hypothetical protein
MNGDMGTGRTRPLLVGGERIAESVEAPPFRVNRERAYLAPRVYSPWTRSLK